MISTTSNGFCVKGAMHIYNASALLADGRTILKKASKAQTFTIDLAQVSDADSAALGVLFAWLRTAQQRGLTLCISGLPSTLQSLAQMYGVTAALPLAA